MPKGNSFCSPLGRWEVKARAAQGSSHSPGIEMKAGLLESELENSKIHQVRPENAVFSTVSKLIAFAQMLRKHFWGRTGYCSVSKD